MQSGNLYIVATPIGNLQDMTQRAIEVLQSVDLIYAEDTRHSKKLLLHINVKTPLSSFHDHNESHRTKELLQKLKEGKQLALISDAGTPLISDPGYHIVHQAQQEGFNVIPIPGACALITALCASGLATDRFIFEGFLPAKTAARKKYLSALQYESRTIIFYESCHRIVETIKDCIEVLGSERQIVIARELTKTFETIHNAPAAQMLTWLQQDMNQQRGEFVLMLAGYHACPEEISPEAKRMLALLMNELPLKKAAKMTADLTGIKKNRLYEYGLSISS